MGFPQIFQRHNITWDVKPNHYEELQGGNVFWSPCLCGSQSESVHGLLSLIVFRNFLLTDTLIIG